MRTELEKIRNEYLLAKSSSFANHPLVDFIERNAPTALADALGNDLGDLMIAGSAGKGRWADTPWLALMDPIITDSTQRGYYVVYLFAPACGRIVLCLAQGITDVLKRSSTAMAARKRLVSIASLMRSAVPEHKARFPGYGLELDPTKPGNRTTFYPESEAFGLSYEKDLPSDTHLIADLKEMVGLYRLLIFRGIPIEESEADSPLGIEGRRRLGFHWRIERDPALARKAKEVHGLTCQACNFNFEAAYGALGRGYIEAHHLIPLASLPEAAMKRNPKTDFCVLCANCHRMIHRSDCVSDVPAFRKHLLEN